MSNTIAKLSSMVRPSPETNPKIVVLFGMLFALLMAACSPIASANAGPETETRSPANASTANAVRQAEPEVEDVAPGSDAVRNGILIRNGDMVARGNLVWEHGNPFLTTPSGRIDLDLPLGRADGDAAAAQAEGQVDGQPVGQLDVVAAGQWQMPTPLTIAARTVRATPTAVVIPHTCPDQFTRVRLDTGEVAVRGNLLFDGGTLYLRSSGGLVQVHTDRDLSQLDPTRNMGQFVIVGAWKAAPGELHVDARQIVRVRTNCAPEPVLLPGEVAAIGTLVWDNGTPYLSTPSGKILLRRPSTADMATDVDRVLAEMESATDATRLHILAVGKWVVRDNQLIIEVRYIRHWPLNQPMPVPAPEPDDAVANVAPRL